VKKILLPLIFSCICIALTANEQDYFRKKTYNLFFKEQLENIKLNRNEPNSYTSLAKMAVYNDLKELIESGKSNDDSFKEQLQFIQRILLEIRSDKGDTDLYTLMTTKCLLAMSYNLANHYELSQLKMDNKGLLRQMEVEMVGSSMSPQLRKAFHISKKLDYFPTIEVEILEGFYWYYHDDIYGATDCFFKAIEKIKESHPDQAEEFNKLWKEAIEQITPWRRDI